MTLTAGHKWAIATGILLIAVTAVGIRVLPRYFARLPATVLVASGRIEGRDVTIAPKDVHGRVTLLCADEGDSVKAGDLLAELEIDAVAARVAGLAAVVARIDAEIAQASLDVILTAKRADASIASAAAAASATAARATRARAVLANAASERQRAVQLFAGAVISRHELDQMETVARAAEADLAAAEKEGTRAEADLALARASRDAVPVKQQQVAALQQSRRAAEAQLAEAQAAFAERRVVAPADGTILSRPVEVGDVVSPGTPMFQVVDLSRLYVKVYLPEPDVPKLRLGDRADVRVDAFPQRTFAARVSKIYDQAEFTPKNVETADERLKLVFGVELALENGDRLLKPGMPADCTIHFHGS